MGEKIREKEVQEFNDCDYIADKISIAHRHGIILRISYNLARSPADEIVGSVSPLDVYGFCISNASGVLPIPYCAVLVASVYVPEPPLNDRKERGFPELVGKCGFAKRRCHMIMGYWCDYKDCQDYIPEDPLAGMDDIKDIPADSVIEVAPEMLDMLERASASIHDEDRVLSNEMERLIKKARGG